MSTTIRPELSKQNKYYIPKHRYYELKHFCLQYPEWKTNYEHLFRQGNDILPLDSKLIEWSDPTGNTVAIRELYLSKMELVEQTCEDADESLAPYILKSVTEGQSFTYLSMMLGIPCGKDMFYDRYRRFFWILDKRKR